MSVLRALALGNSKNKAWIPTDNGIHMDLSGRVYRVAVGDFFLDPQRILRHPSFPQVEGQGVFTYDFNPDDTLNFIYSVARKVDSQVLRTIASSVLVRSVEEPADVIIQEIWTGGSGKASALASMYRTLYNFWLTTPAVGESLTWFPQDLSTESFGVEIAGLELGGVDIAYREFRERRSSTQNALLESQLTLKLKIVGESVSPKGVVTLSGI